MWCGARDHCGRHAEVVVHIGAGVAVPACMSDGVRLARNIETYGDDDVVQVVLIDDHHQQLTIGPRGA